MGKKKPKKVNQKAPKKKEEPKKESWLLSKVKNFGKPKVSKKNQELLIQYDKGIILSVEDGKDQKKKIQKLKGEL